MHLFYTVHGILKLHVKNVKNIKNMFIKLDTIVPIIKQQQIDNKKKKI